MWFSTPSALIVDDEPLQRRFARQVLKAAGWDVRTAASGDAALAMLAPPLELVLLDLHMAGMTGAETLAAIREQPEPLGTVPVIAFTTTRLFDLTTLRGFGFDGFLAKPCTPDELSACAARWAPGASTQVLPRLEQLFGRDELRGMIARFRGLLVEALVQLDANAGREIAHRVAGIAGTLGFSLVGRLWLDYSEGAQKVENTLRRATLLAIADIDGLHEEPA